MLGQSSFWYGHLLGVEGIKVHVVDEVSELNSAFASYAQSLTTVKSLDSIDEMTWVAGHFSAQGIKPILIHVGSEKMQLSRAYLAAALGLESPNLAITARTRDKRIMKTYAKSAGIEIADFISINDPTVFPKEQYIIDTVGFPCVVKPASGVSSALTYACYTMQDAIYALDRQKSPAIIETFLKAKQFHADAVWHLGKPLIFMVSEYGVSPLDLSNGIGCVSSMAYDPAYQSELYSAALNLSLSVNRALGIEEGPTHMEFFLLNDNLIFSEIGTRLGGSIVPRLVKLWCGVDMRDIYLHHALGLVADFPLILRPPEFPILGIINIAPPKKRGIITNLPSLEAIMGEVGILYAESIVQVGQTNDPTIDTGLSWGVLAICGSYSVSEVFEYGTYLNEQYSITVK